MPRPSAPRRRVPPRLAGRLAGLSIPWLLACLGCAPDASDGERVSTGFLGRVYEGPEGQGAKYVVFLPHDYDAKKAYPTILYLHGAGQSGTDGRAQVGRGLAEAIRQRERTFPFIVVFPQSRHGSWRPRSGDGRLAVAILDEVARDYAVDVDRVVLTGVSMGGEGTWSLAAAHPERWAALVPVCGGGDPQTAARIKDIPCWCFHGDADRVVSVERSREMIRALRRAGGRPLYHEFPGVGHNCWERAYAMPDLDEWLLQQRRK